MPEYDKGKDINGKTWYGTIADWERAYKDALKRLVEACRRQKLAGKALQDVKDAQHDVLYWSEKYEEAKKVLSE